MDSSALEELEGLLDNTDAWRETTNVTVNVQAPAPPPEPAKAPFPLRSVITAATIIGTLILEILRAAGILDP